MCILYTSVSASVYILLGNNGGGGWGDERERERETPNTGLRHTSYLKEGAGKRCSRVRERVCHGHILCTTKILKV